MDIPVSRCYTGCVLRQPKDIRFRVCSRIHCGICEHKLLWEGTVKRTYQETHPWITFALDLQRASYRLWLLLGETQARCASLRGVPLLPEVAKRLQRLYLARGARATTAIEGNTLSEEQVLLRLDRSLDLPPSRSYLGQEIDNIVAAFAEIGLREAAGELGPLTVAEMQSYNRLVLRGLPLDGAVAGEIREHGVVVGGYRGAPARDCTYLLQRLCSWLSTDLHALPGYEMAFGALKAIVAHIYLAWIHPFGDGNGRTARLLEFRLLLSSGIPEMAAHLVSDHYNRTRSEYYRQLEGSHRGGGSPFPFIEYALQGLIDGLEEQQETIRQQQLEVHWSNHIHHVFGDTTTDAERRRRRLILDLSPASEPVPLPRLRHVSPAVAEAYAGMSDKTLRRDVEQLERLGLVLRTEAGIRPRREVVLAL